MIIRTTKIDIEKILDDIWLRFTCDMQASVSASEDKVTLDELLHEDRLKAKYKLEVLKDCAIIAEEEYNEMTAKIDVESENIMTMFKNRVKINKED
ncbi:MAG: hypothetical protein J6R32_02460 [Bacteroidales bacterium]|nr:hypothetical protein [Bacteroidales bacterium]